MPWSLRANEERFLREHRSHDVDHLIRRWKALARQAGWRLDVIAEAGGFPIVAVSSPVVREDRAAVYLSAGIHGDEPAGVVGLLEWAEENVVALCDWNLVVFPCLNPWGLVQNCRLDARGRDLNRSFGEEEASPIREWREFMAGRCFDVAATLHEDYDAHGAYLYELTRHGRNDGDRLLKKVDPVMPRQQGRADGQALKNGVKRRSRGIARIADTIDGVAEAILLHLDYAQVSLTFETPSEFSLYRRVEAQKRFLTGVAEMARNGE